jgi:hypothetical protein
MKKALKIFGLLALGFIIGFIAAPNGTTVIETVQEELPEEEVGAQGAEEEAQKLAAEQDVVKQEPTKVFENDSIIISFVEVTTEGAKFLVENKTSVNITIQADSVSVNGFSSNDITMSDDVSPNSKGYVTARTGELTDVGIPEKVSGSLRVIDFNESFESYSAMFTDIVIKQ